MFRAFSSSSLFPRSGGVEADQIELFEVESYDATNE